MRKASEYRQHAAECRALAAAMAQSGQRDQLIQMAETWDGLADERERMLRTSAAASSAAAAGPG